MWIEPVMPSNHLILCCPLLLLPSIFPSIGVFSNESALHIRWPKYCNFSFSISPSNEYSGFTGLISLFNILLSTNRNRFGPWYNWRVQLENSYSTEWIGFILMNLMEFKWFWEVYVCTRKGQCGNFGYAYLLCSQQDHSNSRIRPISPSSEGPMYNVSTGVDERSLFLPTT